jgi:cell division protein FtsL
MATMAIGHEMGRMETERPGPNAGRSRARGVTERNYELFEQQRSRRRGPTPEMFFAKHIDNSRIVKADDPERRREMRSFTIAMTMCFVLTMVYVWQHFSAIETGYKVETQKQQVEQMREDNRQLRLMDAQLSDPGRIDVIATQLGLHEPMPGQVIRQDAVGGATPVLAQAQAPVAPLDAN